MFEVVPPREWEIAPTYENPASHVGLLVLDFVKLKDLAEQETLRKSFRKIGECVQMAPAIFDGTPGAFYKVRTKYPGFTPERAAFDQETLIAIEGVINLRTRSTEATVENPDPQVDLTQLIPGEVINLKSGRVAMQNLSLNPLANEPSLAVALFRETEVTILL